MKTAATDRFEAISPLGRGGMGEVWLVRDRKSGELVSLKKIDAEQARSPLGQRLRREFLHLKKLSHPSILRVHDFGVSPKTGETWFTSEVLRGPVSTEIAGQITLQQWWQMSAGFLRALSFMHRNRWVHGDIKPSNILKINDKLLILRYTFSNKICSFILLLKFCKKFIHLLFITK